MFCKSSGKSYMVRVARCRKEKGGWVISKRFVTWALGLLPPERSHMVLASLVRLFSPALFHEISPNGRITLKKHFQPTLSDRVQRVTWALVTEIPKDSPPNEGEWSAGISQYTPDGDQYSRRFGSALAVARALMLLGDPEGAHEVAGAAKVPDYLFDPSVQALPKIPVVKHPEAL